MAPLERLDRTVRWAVYRSFIETGRAPTAEALAARVAGSAREAGTAASAAGGAADGGARSAEVEPSPAAIEASLSRLAARRWIVLAPGSSSVWMAHPFSAVPTPYPVEAAGVTYWANCAWDALGIPALLGVDGRTRAMCADCGEPLELAVSAGVVSSDAERVHFGVPPRRFWENVGFT